MTRRTWTDEQLTLAVQESTSVSQVLTALGLKVTGANYMTMYLHVERLGLSTSHFLGQRWNRQGRNLPPVRPLEEILVEDSSYVSTASLKSRLVNAGLLIKKCYRCGLTEWLGEPIVLQLEHKNGVRRDNRIENLCLLCPNCHSQTSTYAGRNVRRPAR